MGYESLLISGIAFLLFGLTTLLAGHATLERNEAQPSAIRLIALRMQGVSGLFGGGALVPVRSSGGRDRPGGRRSTDSRWRQANGRCPWHARENA